MNNNKLSFQIEFDAKIERVDQYFELVFLLDELDEISFSEIGKLTDYQSLNDLSLLNLKFLGGIYKLDIDLKKILKANCYLILYNLIEGSLVSGISAIFDEINSHIPLLKYKDVNEKIKVAWFKYKHKQYNLKSSKPKPEIVQALEKIYNEEVFFEHEVEGVVKSGHEAYLDTVGREVSANIDEKNLQYFADLYGFQAPITSATEIGIVKDLRNKLAHGEISFSEAGRTNTIEDLVKIKNKVFIYLDELLKNIAKYIKDEDYKV